MAAPQLKLYHKDEINTRELLQMYFSTDEESPFGDESIYFPMKKLHDSLAAGHFKGKSVYDFSVSAIIHQLYTVNDFYPEITILKLNETCIMELNKWLATRTGAFDWGNVHKYAKELHGVRDDQEEINKEDILKCSIKQIVKFDLETDNLTDPVVLEQADCITSAWLLDAVCRDQNEYIRYFQKMKELLKPGGLLILWGCLNATYYTVGKERYHACNYDESFLRNLLINERFKIHTWEVLDSKMETHLADYKQLFCVTAVKETA